MLAVTIVVHHPDLLVSGSIGGKTNRRLAHSWNSASDFENNLVSELVSRRSYARFIERDTVPQASDRFLCADIHKPALRNKLPAVDAGVAVGQILRLDFVRLPLFVNNFLGLRWQLHRVEALWNQIEDPRH